MIMPMRARLESEALHLEAKWMFQFLLSCSTYPATSGTFPAKACFYEVYGTEEQNGRVPTRKWLSHTATVPSPELSNQLSHPSSPGEMNNGLARAQEW